MSMTTAKTYIPTENTVQAISVTWKGIIVNLVLMVLKLVAGFLGHSKAMIADGVESVADMPANLVVLLGIAMGNRPADKTHDFGHGKIETLASTMVGAFLVAAGLWIFGNGAQAVWRNIHGTEILRPGWIALAGTVLAIVTKEWLYRYTLRVGRRVNSQAVIANAWHHRSDAYTSMGTLTGISGAFFLGPHWRFLDPLAAIVASVFIVKMGITISWQGLNELIEASESDEKEADIIRIISSVPGVQNPHRLRTRRIGNQTAIDVHVEVDGRLSVTDAHQVATRIEEHVREAFGMETLVLVHIEPLGDRDGA